MKRVVYGEDARVCDWVAPRVGEESFATHHDPVGIGLEQDGELIAGVVFNYYTGPSIQIHVAAEPTKKWLTREYLFKVFAYPFLQLQCKRVTGLVRSDNLPAQKFDEHLGFRREGVIRQGCTDGTDLILYGMLATECRFLTLGRN
jgi:RimJ/RimL family protein N-acetyltransferase